MKVVPSPLTRWLVAGAALLLSNVAAARAGLPDFTDLVEQTSPAVVNISTVQKVEGKKILPHGWKLPELPDDSPLNDFFRRFFDDEGGGGAPEHDARSLGSGFIISEDGYLLTNHHVIDGADEVIVRLSDRRELKADVVGSDPRSDIALLKVDADHLPVVKIGNSDKLKRGEWVLAIGSPFGFDHSVTAGIISATGRSLPSENYVPFIQTDVAINPGNSGGPLFDMDGEVIGINSQIYSRTGGYMGLSFSIPIEMAMEVADQLKKSGKVSRGWLGVLIQDVTRELAESFGMERPYGALVSKVLPDSPAEAAGFKVGDVIIEFDGREVERSGALPPMVGRAKVGSDVPVVVIRNGKRTTLKVNLGELPEEEEMAAAGGGKAKTSADRIGLVVSDPTADQRNEMELGDEKGVLVQSVEEGPAAHAGIRPGDLIQRINNVAVEDAGQFAKLVAELPDDKSLPVLVLRKGSPLFLALKIGKE
ncbi:DegQ family serine endoprotease [Endothiovibrio diazotrophicus]